MAPSGVDEEHEIFQPRKVIKNGKEIYMKIKIVPSRRDRNYYKPGDEVVGLLMLQCPDLLRFMSLSVTLMGVARAWRQEKRSGIQALFQKPEVLTQHMTFFKEKKLLVGGSDSLQCQQLPCGQHEYAFTFTLPEHPDMQSSFHGHNGFIRYFALVELCESFAITHKSAKEIRVITKSEAVEETRGTIVPIMAIRNFHHYGLTYFISAITKKKNYGLGETIRLNGYVCNYHHDLITPLIRLFQVQTYYVNLKDGSAMETFQVQVAHAQGRTTSDREIDLEDLTLQIPTTITPSVTDFRLIKIEYEAQVTVQSHRRGGASQSRHLPINVLSHPLPESVPLPVYDNPLRPQVEATPSAPPASDLPPSYESSVHSSHVRLPPESRSAHRYSVDSLPPSYAECMNWIELPPSYEEAMDMALQSLINS